MLRYRYKGLNRLQYMFAILQAQILRSWLDNYVLDLCWGYTDCLG